MVKVTGNGVPGAVLLMNPEIAFSNFSPVVVRIERDYIQVDLVRVCEM
jgi:hypothetical protein